MRQIRIDKLPDGFAVKVGCRTVLFSSASALLSELKDYIENPERVERLYVSVNDKHPTPDGISSLEYQQRMRDFDRSMQHRPNPDYIVPRPPECGSEAPQPEQQERR